LFLFWFGVLERCFRPASDTCICTASLSAVIRRPNPRSRNTMYYLPCVDLRPYLSGMSCRSGSVNVLGSLGVDLAAIMFCVGTGWQL
jgi:hypothetical protein